MTKYAEYVIKESFDIHPTKAYKYTNAELFHKDGTTPVVTNTSKNHGRSGYSNFQPTEANIITFSDTGTKSPDSFFYQEGTFIGYAHVQGMYPYSEKWSKKSLLYLIALLKSKTAGEYDYSTKMTREDILNMKVMLPVDIDDNIDFAYMENYISNLQEERVKELKIERIGELERYLQATGFTDYSLTKEETRAMSLYTNNLVSYSDFRIGDLFDIHPTKSYGLTNKTLFQTKGNTPVVVNSSSRNGIGGYVDRPPTEKGNIITYTDTTTSDGIFYQPDDFIGYSHIQGLYPLNNVKWSENALLYFVAVFKKCASGRFDYATKFNRKVAMEMIVKLPVTSEGDIDFDFMENFIEAQKKLAIKDVVDWKDKIISTTKKFANNT